jgi:fumarylacetoacetase
VSIALDETHDASLASWVESANDPEGDFPIQNLPFGRFRRDGGEGWRIGVAIGDRVLDLQAAGLVDHQDMHRLMAEAPALRRALRLALSLGLRRGSAERGRFAGALLAQDQVELGLPCTIGDYTDFYTGIHHATTVGKLFRPENPLLPNYKWVPIGYHGRGSSIAASGQRFRRPLGQLKPAGDAPPLLGPTARLDYELELGIFVGRGNALGDAIPVESAEDHVFGLALLNDWSARDLQAWEYQPLGPFLSKNFATTVSPWIVTLDALAPFRAPFDRAAGDPQPLPYLDAPAVRSHGMVDITLEVWLQTAAMRDAGQPAQRLTRSNFRDAYWALAQLVAHHTVNGCNLSSGDLLGSGTISGPGADQGGSLLELTQGGKRALQLANGQTRTFLEDGDTVILRAHCERPGQRRIGFGDCAATVLPARDIGVGAA